MGFIGIFCELCREYFTRCSALQYADFYIEQAQTEDAWSVIIYNTLTNDAIQSFAQQLNKMAALNSKPLLSRASNSPQLLVSWSNGQLLNHFEPSLATAVIDGKDVELTKAYLSKLRQTQKIVKNSHRVDKN
jgi:hypothetical protein